MKINRSTDVRHVVRSTGLGSHKVTGTVWDRWGNWPPGRRAWSKTSCSSAWPNCAKATTKVKTTDREIWQWDPSLITNNLMVPSFCMEVCGHLWGSSRCGQENVPERISHTGRCLSAPTGQMGWSKEDPHQQWPPWNYPSTLSFPVG